jgi:hypothetical protein
MNLEMIKRHLFIIVILFPFILIAQEVNLPVPADYFGFKPGTDRELFTYEQLVGYLQNLDDASGKIKMVQIGESPLGKPMYVCLISSEENISNIDRLKQINKSLALDPDIPETERNKIIEEGKVFVYATLSMHSNEVGPSQAAPLVAYELATTEDPVLLESLDNVVYMMVACHNPDGMDMMVEHYKKYRDTKYDGCSMPGVYHKYVGHDNNRDFITLSQKDTKAIASVYNLEWFPQVMVEKHQMGSRGVRYFVPPPHDPIAMNIDAGIWNWMGVFGSNLITDMTKDSLAGVAQHYLFDDYWPGSTETCIWKNVIGMLTECASVQLAKPVYIEPNELGAYGKGLSEYKKGINMPYPWEGGWWRLGDIIDYELSSTFSLIKTASKHRAEILTFRNDLCRKEVQKGKTEAPYYYIMPKKQHDQSEMAGIVNLLKEQGIDVFTLSKDVTIDDYPYSAGDVVVPLAQPFRSFIKEVMEVQEFPVRHYTPDGSIIKPYDITSWSLPLHRGVKSIEINTKSEELEASLTKIEGDYAIKHPPMLEYEAFIFPAGNNESYKAAFYALAKGWKVDRAKESFNVRGEVIDEGSFLVYKYDKFFDSLLISPAATARNPDVELETLKMPKIALVETFFHDMDAGWTRYVFDQYRIPYTVVHPQDFEKTDFNKDFDVVVFPSTSKDILKSGKYKSGSGYYISSYPPEYSKGMGDKGMQNLMTFLDNGGIIVSWGRSTELFNTNLKIKLDDDNSEEFRLPFNDISGQLSKKGLYCPGSFVKVNLKKNHSLTLGMDKSTGIFYRGKPVFSTSIPKFDMDRRVIATFPEKDILLSGYIENGEKLGNKTAMVWLRKGKGQLVLMAFNPQFRASTQGTFKLLFNSLLLKKIE